MLWRKTNGRSSSSGRTSLEGAVTFLLPLSLSPSPSSDRPRIPKSRIPPFRFQQPVQCGQNGASPLHEFGRLLAPIWSRFQQPSRRDSCEQEGEEGGRRAKKKRQKKTRVDKEQWSRGGETRFRLHFVIGRIVTRLAPNLLHKVPILWSKNPPT